MAKMSRTEMKIKAQEILMDGLANQLGYFDPTDFDENYSEEDWAEIKDMMKHQADRVAKMFGYEEAWAN